jgi:hypothetical protein
MAFRIKNINNFIVRILGITLQAKQTVDLTNNFTNAQIRDSLLEGELYHKLQGRYVALVSPAIDLGTIGLSVSQLSLLIHSGIAQGFQGMEELKPPFGFNGDGYLNINLASTEGAASAMSVRGVVGDNLPADGFPVEIGGINELGNIQSLLVDSDGYLKTSTSFSIELNNEVEGRVFDGEIGTGIKPVIISGLDEDGYSQSILTDGLGELILAGYDAPADALRTYETAPLNTTYLLEELINASNLSVDTYTYSITMDNYADLSIEFELDSACTMTIEASNDSGFTTAKDITLSGNELVSGTNGYASFSNSDGILDYSGLNVSYVRVKLVISNATNTVKIVSRKKAL